MTHRSILESCLRGVTRLPEAYGMTLRIFVAEEYGEDIAIGTIYAAMSELEQNGEVISKRVEGGPERGGRPKTVWHLAGG